MAETAQTNLVRPLRIIEQEIREHIEAGDRAASEAGEIHYRRAAPLLVEAKEGHFDGNTAGFYEWAQKKFVKSRTQIMTWTGYAIAVPHKPFKNIQDFRYAPKKEGGLGRNPIHNIGRVGRSWTRPVDEVAERARKEAFRLAQEDALSRAEEREAERKLASRLIDIGYKVLAKELHPDKMRGDKSAFQRLARVRDKLKHCI